MRLICGNSIVPKYTTPVNRFVAITDQRSVAGHFVIQHSVMVRPVLKNGLQCFISLCHRTQHLCSTASLALAYFEMATDNRNLKADNETVTVILTECFSFCGLWHSSTFIINHFDLLA
jgi:hypothetical protein